MNLLEKLEAEQAAGWPTPPEPDGPWRRQLQRLLTILTRAWLEAEDSNNPARLRKIDARSNGGGRIKWCGYQGKDNYS